MRQLGGNTSGWEKQEEVVMVLTKRKDSGDGDKQKNLKICLGSRTDSENLETRSSLLMVMLKIPRFGSKRYICPAQ